MTKATILIIADKEDMKGYSFFSLESERIEIHSFEKAIEKIRHCTVDIILIDSGFDAEKGLNLLTESKKTCHNIPIIFLTYVSSEDVAVRAFKSGAREYIKKPFDLVDLQNIVKNILSIKRSSKEKRNPYISKITSPVISLQGEKQQNIIKAVRYIEENLSKDISLKKMAREVGLSPYYFCREFKKCTGKSPKKFIIYQRIEKAKELLKKGFKITDIAINVGFNDLPNFNKQFKKIIGMTPTEYRNLLKNRSKRQF